MIFTNLFAIRKYIVSLNKFLVIWFINGQSSFVVFFKDKQNFFTFFLNEIILNVWILIFTFSIPVIFQDVRLWKINTTQSLGKHNFYFLSWEDRKRKRTKYKCKGGVPSATRLALPRKDFSLCLTICGNYQRKLGHITFWSYVS